MLAWELLRIASDISRWNSQAGKAPSQLLESCLLGKQWVGYLSTTSVYGDHQGRMVSEGYACQQATTGIHPCLLSRVLDWVLSITVTPCFVVRMHRPSHRCCWLICMI